MWNMKKECIFHKCKCKIVRVCVCVFVHECRWLNVDVQTCGSKQRKKDSAAGHTAMCVCTLNQTKFGSFRFFPPLVLIGCRCIANKATAVIMVLDHQAPVSLTQSQFKWVLLVLQLQQGRQWWWTQTHQSCRDQRAETGNNAVTAHNQIQLWSNFGAPTQQYSLLSFCD